MSDSDLDLSTSGTINLGGLKVGYTIDLEGRFLVKCPSHEEAVALARNLVQRLRRADLLLANSEGRAPDNGTHTPAPAKATMTATPAPAEKSAKPKAPRKPAPVKAAPKEDEPQPGPAQPAVMPKRRGRPPKNPAAVA